FGTGPAAITRTGSSTNTIALGAVNNLGGSLNLGADNIATTTTALTNGLLPAYITVNGGLATKDGSNNILAYTGYTNVDRLGGAIIDSSGANISIIEAGTSGNVTLPNSGITNIGTLLNAGTVAPTLVDIGSGNTLRLNNLGTISAGTNGLTITNGTLTAGGIADTAGTVDIFNSSAPATAVSSVIADNGTGVVGLAKSGIGVLTLSAANTYTGTTTVNGGTLALTGGSSIADTGAVSLANSTGATLRLDSSETIGSLASGAASTVNLQANTLTIAGTATTTASGVISGTGTLVKQGSGTQILAGVNTYSGGTTLTEGALTATVSATGDKWRIQGVTTSAPVIVDSGSQLYPVITPSTLSGGITISGTGNSEARGAIRLATTLGGNITLAGDTARIDRLSFKGGEGLLTGYYEPMLEASRQPSANHAVPLYRPPASLAARKPWFTRQ
ncbi:MAG: hypothetical protein CFE44_23095, partial [Burkholderiales bacterium PBB4]